MLFVKLGQIHSKSACRGIRNHLWPSYHYRHKQASFFQSLFPSCLMPVAKNFSCRPFRGQIYFFYLQQRERWCMGHTWRKRWVCWPIVHPAVLFCKAWPFSPPPFLLPDHKTSCVWDAPQKPQAEDHDATTTSVHWRCKHCFLCVGEGVFVLVSAIQNLLCHKTKKQHIDMWSVNISILLVLCFQNTNKDPSNKHRVWMIYFGFAYSDNPVLFIQQVTFFHLPGINL